MKIKTSELTGDGWCWSCFNSTVVDYVSGA